LKRKPDQVITHRFELQQKERELLGSYVAAYQIQNISKPIVDILKDTTALIAISGFLLLFFDDKLQAIGLDPDWPEITAGMDNEQIADWLETQNLIGAGIGGFLGFIIGGFVGSYLGPVGTVAGAGAGAVGGAAAGNYTVEQLEDLAEEAKKAAQLAEIAALIALSVAIREAKELAEALANPGGGIPYISGI